MNILLINACIREDSRTKILADYLLTKLSGNLETIDLNQDEPQPFNREILIKRNKLLQEGNHNDPMFSYAQKFASADIIVMAVPYWDLSFPALFKTFIEYVNAIGIVFKYSPEGQIIPLCRAKTLYYITTMGGYNPMDFGFGYIQFLAKNMYGIQDVRLIKAEGLDVQGNEVPQILKEAQKQIDLSV